VSRQVSKIDYVRFCLCGAMAGLAFAGALGFEETINRDLISSSLGILAVVALRFKKVL
jgi:hypothetical protein